MFTAKLVSHGHWWDQNMLMTTGGMLSLCTMSVIIGLEVVVHGYLLVCPVMIFNVKKCENWNVNNLWDSLIALMIQTTVINNVFMIFVIYMRHLTCNGSPVSSTNKTGRHNITEILLKVVLNNISACKLLHAKRFQGTIAYSLLHGFFILVLYAHIYEA
jgi:hypothetical protein